MVATPESIGAGTALDLHAVHSADAALSAVGKAVDWVAFGWIATIIIYVVGLAAALTLAVLG